MICFEVSDSPVEGELEQTSADHTEQLHLGVHLEVHSEEKNPEVHLEVHSEVHSEEKNSGIHSEVHLEEKSREQYDLETQLEQSLSLQKVEQGKPVTCD